MDSVHHIWCPLSSQEYQDLPDGAETTLTDMAGSNDNDLSVAAFEDKPKRNKVKYQCRGCGAAVWGKAGLNIECGDCELAFIEN
ncbi:hypothetical protein MMB85_005416 [Klebsiella quasipneumoniae]